MKYLIFARKSDKLKSNVYNISENGYQYTIAFPRFLKNAGNLAVTDNDLDTVLFIWPHVFKKTEFAVWIGHEETGFSAEHIYLNKNLMPLNLKYEEFINLHKSEVKERMEKAYSKWPLLCFICPM
jgi:hypothetical protein